jgi:hypothetical protein
MARRPDRVKERQCVRLGTNGILFVWREGLWACGLWPRAKGYGTGALAQGLGLWPRGYHYIDYHKKNY